MAVRQTTTKNMNITTLYNMHTPITHKIELTQSYFILIGMELLDNKVNSGFFIF